MRLNTIPIVRISFFVFFILIISCKGKKVAPNSRPKSDGPVIVDVMVATLQKVNNTIEASGTVIANENVDLHPDATGLLTYLNIPEGKFVKAGTVLARVNSADLVAQLEKSKVQLDLAQKNEERLHKLLLVNGVNESDYDAAVNLVESTKADINYTQALIDKTVVRSPFDGTIGLRQVSPGAYVSPATVLATLQQLGKLKVDFTLPEEYGNLVKVGNTVDVEVDASSHKRQKATIIAIEPQANTQTRNLSVRALLQGGSVNPGAFVKVYISAEGSGRSAVMVPTSTIIPNDINNQLVVIKNNKSQFVNVTTGMRLANNVEITKGVNPGDTVVLTGVLFARPNGPVKIRSVKTLTQADDNN
ncbi:MAG TPA: efflux RND transporter periplasmic adaptor subunit [Chitinophagaceae bacterium]|nr:efflux RND transporter periplasmic adaptor subunit [Chitinophagaceae bacterium]